MIKKWQVLTFDRSAAEKFAAEAGISPLLAVLMQTRGVSDVLQAQEMLSDRCVFSDPFLLPDMQKAVDRITEALDGFEKIAVYGDYDADGVTATAILYSYLESCGGNVVYYIPDRESEGYGLNIGAIDALHEQGVNLIVTVDNGISSVDEVKYASQLGMDTVVTDHHRPRDVLPEAVAVVDAWRKDCTAPYREYSGAGVAFKLLSALEGAESGTEEALLDNYADLVAIGTIGDVVPLTGENRMFVKAGLKLISRTDRLGLRSLLELSGIEGRPVTATTAAFTIIPRINATGRMGSPDRAVRLLTTESPEEAGELAAEICKDNGVRRSTENEILGEVMKKLGERPELLLDRVLVVDGEEWHHGVIGIVAARLTELFGKPCIVISRSGEEAKGSGRSVEGFSLFDAVCSCGDLLTKYGGHPMAAGMSLPAANVPEFRTRLNRYAALLPQPMPALVLKIDCVLKPDKLSVKIPEDLRALEPFGTGNTAPLFGLPGMTVADISPVGGGKHLRITMKKGNASVTCMKFGTTLENFPYRTGDTVDLAVQLESRPYAGVNQLTVIIRDMRFAGFDADGLIGGRALYEKFRRGETLTEAETAELLPTRDSFAVVYRALRNGGGYRGTLENFCFRLQGGSAGFAKLLTVFAVFSERGLIDCQRSGNIYSIRVRAQSGKVSLTESPLVISLHSDEKAGEQ